VFVHGLFLDYGHVAFLWFLQDWVGGWQVPCQMTVFCRYICRSWWCLEALWAGSWHHRRFHKDRLVVGRKEILRDYRNLYRAESMTWAGRERRKRQCVYHSVRRSGQTSVDPGQSQQRNTITRGKSQSIWRFHRCLWA
jgi:hypothetical protein